jgi:hypothetical protein
VDPIGLHPPLYQLKKLLEKVTLISGLFVGINMYKIGTKIKAEFSLYRLNSWKRQDIFSLLHSNQTNCGIHSRLLFNGYKTRFPHGKSSQGVKLITCLYLGLTFK